MITRMSFFSPRLLLLPLLTVLAGALFPGVRAAGPAVAPTVAAAPMPTEYVLKGHILDRQEQPLAGVRVGFRSAGVATETDAKGEFSLTLPLKPGQVLKKDNTNTYEAVELDKEGHMGRTVDIKDLGFFDQRLTEKLLPYPVTADRAELTLRMGLDITLPPITTGKEFSLITPEQWQKWLAGMGDRKRADGRTEQVVVQAYIPVGVAELKAMFLLTRHGIGSIDHPRLRDFANRNGVALVGVKGNPVQRGFYPVDLLDEPIARLGQMLKHPELETLPVISFGHSNGTGFAGILASQRPGRVLAWISYHSGAAFHLQFPGVEKVPGLVMHGLIDPFFKNGQEPTVKRLRQERNAALAMMLEANVAHGPADRDQNATWDFIAAFSEAALRTRLAADGTVRPVVIEQGWLGATYDRVQGGQQELAIAPYAAFQGDKSTASWLPDQTFAETWQRYGQTDPREVK